jgi:hypothetical protein
VLEWNDLNDTAGSSRVLRGGGWPNDASVLSSSVGIPYGPSFESNFFGFRLASRFVTLNPLNLSYFVNVGDSGNSNDVTGYGGVSYEYVIAQYVVTNCEYAAFLNAVASTDTYNLYNTLMDDDYSGGITRSGSSGSYTYSVKTNMGNKPVVYVNWFDCARYCNWLHNNKPFGTQNTNTTEDGAYTLTALYGTINGDAVPSNPGAKYHLPTENEWYKAAYYKSGGTNAGYWKYATQSDTDPIRVFADSSGNGILNDKPANTSKYVCPATAPSYISKCESIKNTKNITTITAGNKSSIMIIATGSNAVKSGYLQIMGPSAPQNTYFDPVIWDGNQNGTMFVTGDIISFNSSVIDNITLEPFGLSTNKSYMIEVVPTISSIVTNYPGSQTLAIRDCL